MDEHRQYRRLQHERRQESPVPTSSFRPWLLFEHTDSPRLDTIIGFNDHTCTGPRK
jgi:hypothetical protein